MKLTYILPTCEPESMFRFLLPSIHYLNPVKQLLEFNIIFQPPYTKKKIKTVLKTFKKQHIKVNYIFKDYKVVKPYTPLIKMRNDCAMMSPNSDIYGLIDDDMSFESEEICEYIKSMINDFENNENLSVISFYNQPVENHRENFYSTNAGLFYRGGKYFGFNGLVPEYLTDFNKEVKTKIPYEGENLINLFGGHQDKFCAMIRLATGTYGEQINNVPVNHLENRLARGDQQHGWKDAEILKGSIADFILKYFNENFIETHALTLFDNETNQKIYPERYENGILKDEFDLYDDRGIIKNWFKTYFPSPRSPKERLHWKTKRYIAFYDHLKETGLINELPSDIITQIENLIEESKQQNIV